MILEVILQGLENNTLEKLELNDRIDINDVGKIAGNIIPVVFIPCQ